MTEEELLALRAQLLKAAQDKADMLSQSAMAPEMLAQLTEQAGYDPAGKEAMLATMLRGGQDAVFGEMPQGRTVGDQYLAPSWSESLNGAAQKLVGGYQMGQARKEQTAIDEKRGLSKTAAAKAAAEQARMEQQAVAEAELNKLVNGQVDDERANRQMIQTGEIAAANRAAAQARFEQGQANQDNRLTRSLNARNAAAANKPPTGRGTNSQPTLYTFPDGTEKYVSMQAGVPTNPDTGERVVMDGAKKKTPKTDYQLTTDAKNLGTRLKDLNTLGDKINQLDTVLKPYMENGTPASEIPGLGRFEKTEGVVGDAARFMSDTLTSGAPAGEVNSAVKGVMNTIIRNQAGMSQTISEIERLTGESATKLLNDPETFLKYYDRLKNTIANDMRTVAATSPPEAVENYRATLAPGAFDPTNPNFARFDETGGKKDRSQMTNEELKAEIEKRKARKK